MRTGDGRLRVRYGTPTRRPASSASGTENEHRAGLSTADKVAATEQLSLLGLSATQIARRTRTPKTDVENALAAGKSKLATGAAQRYDFLTLDPAAIAEFDSDTATVAALVSAARNGDGEFRHVLQRARDDREAAAARQGRSTRSPPPSASPVIDRPGYSETTIRSLRELADAEGAELTRRGTPPAPATRPS